MKEQNTCDVHGVTFERNETYCPVHDASHSSQSVHRCQHACEDTGRSNDKDLEIAKLKLEAFELRQKVRDFQSLHERYLGLQHRYDSMVGQETKKQDDMRGLIEYQTTTAQSMIREIDELKAIHCEQLQRVTETEDSADCHSQTAEQVFMKLEKTKFEYQRRSDQAMQLRKEISDRQKDLTVLQSERHDRQVQLELEKDRYAQAEQDLESTKSELLRKRLMVEKEEALKDSTMRQVQDRKYDLRQVHRKTEEVTQTIEEQKRAQSTTQGSLQECQTMVNCEQETVKRTNEQIKVAQDANADLLREISRLESQASTLNQSVNSVNRRIDLEEVQLRDDCEIAEMCIRENIMRLSEHAEVIKKQNSSLYQELDELVSADEFVREQLRRNDTIFRLKERNSAELSRSMRIVEQSKSMEIQQEMASRAAGLCIYCRQYDGVCQYCCKE